MGALTSHAMDTFAERRHTQIKEALERKMASADAPGNPGLFQCPHCPCPWQTGAMLMSAIVNFDGLLPVNLEDTLPRILL